MSEHTHTELQPPGECFRCDLNRDEIADQLRINVSALVHDLTAPLYVFRMASAQRGTPRGTQQRIEKAEAAIRAVIEKHVTDARTSIIVENTLAAGALADGFDTIYSVDVTWPAESGWSKEERGRLGPYFSLQSARNQASRARGKGATVHSIDSATVHWTPTGEPS